MYKGIHEIKITPTKKKIEILIIHKKLSVF